MVTGRVVLDERPDHGPRRHPQPAVDLEALVVDADDPDGQPDVDAALDQVADRAAPFMLGNVGQQERDPRAAGSDELGDLAGQIDAGLTAVDDREPQPCGSPVSSASANARATRDRTCVMRPFYGRGLRDP